MRLRFLIVLFLLALPNLAAAQQVSPTLYEDMSISLAKDRMGVVVLVSSTLDNPLKFPASDMITPSLGRDVDAAVLAITGEQTHLEVFFKARANQSVQTSTNYVNTVAQILGMAPPALENITLVSGRYEMHAVFNVSMLAAWPKLKPYTMPGSEGYGKLIDLLASQQNRTKVIEVDLDLDENNLPISTLIFSTNILTTINTGVTVDLVQRMGVQSFEASPRSNETTFTIIIPKSGLSSVEYSGAVMNLTTYPTAFLLSGKIPPGTQIQSLSVKLNPTTSTTTTSTTTTTKTNTTTTTTTTTTKPTNTTSTSTKTNQTTTTTSTTTTKPTTTNTTTTKSNQTTTTSTTTKPTNTTTTSTTTTTTTKPTTTTSTTITTTTTTTTSTKPTTTSTSTSTTTSTSQSTSTSSSTANQTTTSTQSTTSVTSPSTTSTTTQPTTSKTTSTISSNETMLAVAVAAVIAVLLGGVYILRRRKVTSP